MLKAVAKKKLIVYGITLIIAVFIFDIIVFPLIFWFLRTVPECDNAEILVVQGWMCMFDTMLVQTEEEIKKRNNYKAIIISGHRFSAQCTRKILKEKGVDDKVLVMAPYPDEIKQNHTFNEAIFVKKELDRLFPNVTSLNVSTAWPHGRKSVTVFRKVFGKKTRVGIVACKPDHYDADHIWKSPHGIYNTIRFFVGYLYALIWHVEWVEK